MSGGGWLGKIAQLAGIALDVVRGVTRRTRSEPPPPAFGRVHAWLHGLSDPPVCAYCGGTLTKSNQYAACSGPAVVSR